MNGDKVSALNIAQILNDATDGGNTVEIYDGEIQVLSYDRVTLFTIELSYKSDRFVVRTDRA